jgi:hypothetical protein
MKKAELTTETPADAKPVLCEVAVLSAYRQKFDEWVKENGKPNEKYHCVMSARDVLGRVFHRIEKTYQWCRMDDCADVKRLCEQRLRNLAN